MTDTPIIRDTTCVTRGCTNLTSHRFADANGGRCPQCAIKGHMDTRSLDKIDDDKAMMNRAAKIDR